MSSAATATTSPSRTVGCWATAGAGTGAVVCVWAGRLVVRTEIRGGSWRETRDLELRKPQRIADGQLILVEAAPSKLADRPIAPAHYRFTFAYEGGL